MSNDRVAAAKLAVICALGGHGIVIKAAECHLVGSTYIRDAIGRDIDILVFLEGQELAAIGFDGWLYGGSVGLGNDHWMSWKKRVDDVEVNMLLTTRKDYLTNWLTAAEVCRFLYLKGVVLKSSDVHGIHEIVMDDSTAENEAKRRNY